MKRVLIMLFVVVMASFALNRDLAKVQTVFFDENEISANSSITNQRPSVNTALSPLPIIGRTEVIGTSTYDWQYNGPVYTHCIVDPVANGVHCGWMYANTQPSAGAPERNQYYNFYDFTTRTWAFGNTGTPVYTARSGFGGMSADPVTGNVVISTHQSIGGVLTPVFARDQVPGGGLFEYSQGPTGYQWPPIGVTYNQSVHSAVISVSSAATGSSDSVYYTRSNTATWPTTWTTPFYIQPPAPSAGFCNQNIAASRTSNKVIVLWEQSEDDYPERAFYRLSTDGGATWGATTQLPFPPSVGGVNPSFHITSLFAMFDAQDNLHIVASVMHYEGTSGYTIPAQIWHYCPANTPAWSLIHHYEADTLNAPVGYNALFATRPSIAQDPTTGNFYVAWEQFDSLNYEPITTLARADIYVAELTNNGQTVTRKGRITDPNTTSKRFPCVGGVKNDTVFVQYIVDSIAGFELYTQGTWTHNPIVVHRFHKNSLPLVGIEENNSNKYYHFTLKPALPNPMHSQTTIHYSLPTKSNVDLTIYDILGRPIKTLVSGIKSAGEYSITWDGTDNAGKKVQSGIYFYTLKTQDKSQTHKLIITN
ncbi:MAG: T9SS type A sorting domain-containing protein [candidate division WOR-3 bacterium]